MEYAAEGFGLVSGAWLAITAAPRALETVGRALATHPEIAYAAATTGSANLVAVCVTRGSAHLYQYLSQTLGGLEGVQHVETSPMQRRVKQLTYQGRM